MAVPMDAAAALPALWLEPRWKPSPNRTVPKSSSATRSYRRPMTSWAAAFLAVLGYFPHSHEMVSKAYTQLARIWYRRRRSGGARSAGSRAVQVERRARRTITSSVEPCASPSSSRKATSRRSSQGMKSLTRDDVPTCTTPRSCEMSMEICADAIDGGDSRRASSRSRRTLRSVQMQLVRQTLPDRSAQANRGRCRGRQPSVIESTSGLGSCGHGIPETSQRRDGRADHRAEAGSDHHRPVARALPHRPRPQRRQPPACRDLSQGRGVLSRRPEFPEPDQGQQRQGDSRESIIGWSPGDRINICDVEFLFYPQLPGRRPVRRNPATS